MKKSVMANPYAFQVYKNPLISRIYKKWPYECLAGVRVEIIIFIANWNN